MNKEYIEGFISKCAEYGIDAEEVVKLAQKMPMVLSGKLLRPAEKGGAGLLGHVGAFAKRHPVLSALGAGTVLTGGAFGLEGLGHYLTNDAPMSREQHEAQLAGREKPGLFQMGRSPMDPTHSGGNMAARKTLDKTKAKGKLPPGIMKATGGGITTQVGRDSEGNPIGY